MAPDWLLFLMNGGTVSPWAVTAFTDPTNLAFFTLPKFTLQTTDLMQPTVNNWYFVVVENVTPGGTVSSTGVWQRITITP
jgi:hypothetical protein